MGEETVLQQRKFVEDNIGAPRDISKQKFTKAGNVEQESVSNGNRSQANKREASTPLSSSSKKFSINRYKTDNKADRIEYIDFGEQGKGEILDLHKKNWLLQRALEKKEQILAFLEMERIVQLEELQGIDIKQ